MNLGRFHPLLILLLVLTNLPLQAGTPTFAKPRHILPTCDGVLIFTEKSLPTPYKNSADMIQGLRQLRETMTTISKAYGENLTEQRQIYLILMAFNASFSARQPVAPEALFEFLKKSYFDSFKQRAKGLIMLPRTRMQLLKVHLEMTRPFTAGEIRNTYYDYIQVVRDLGLQSENYFEPLTIMRLWRGQGLPREQVLVKGHHHPIGTVLLPWGNQTRKLLLFEALALRLGRLPTTLELVQAQKQAENLSAQFGYETFKWVDAKNPNSQPIENLVTLNRPDYWAYLLSLLNGQPPMTPEDILKYRTEHKEKINQALRQVFQSSLPVEIDLIEWDFGFLQRTPPEGFNALLR